MTARFVGMRSGADFRTDKTWRAMLAITLIAEHDGQEHEIEFMTTVAFEDEAQCGAILRDVMTALIGEMPRYAMRDDTGKRNKPTM